jgi:hypothetical protein
MRADFREYFREYLQRIPAENTCDAKKMSRRGRNFKISIGIKTLPAEETEPADGKRTCAH